MKNGPYELVVAPEDYPGKRYRERYVYEHQLVWWKNTSQLVPQGYVVHHKNENKRDNRFSNLELKEMVAHSREHARRVAPVVLQCAWCSESFPYIARNYRYKIKNGQVNFFCSTSHQMRFQQRKLK